MEIILLEKLTKLGNLGDQIKVSMGYALNYLIPQGKAIVANAFNIKRFEERRQGLEEAALERLRLAQERAQALETLATITLSVRSGEEGKLFGSVGTLEVARAITEAGVQVARAEVRLAQPLRNIGSYPIELHLHSDVTVEVLLTLIPGA